jgi:hypothetical protein
MTSTGGATRVPFAEAGAAMRATLLEANAAGLTVRQHRTLAAVLAYTGTYSRLSDRVWLDQVAAFAHGVTEAKPWMRGKVREDLVVLEAAGLIVRKAPRGRPPAGASGPAYLVGIHPAPEKVTPVPGPIETESHPESGVSSNGESHPDPVEKSPRSRVESHPAVRPPTEKVSEETTEEREGQGGSVVVLFPDAVMPNGTHPPAGPSSSIQETTKRLTARITKRARLDPGEIEDTIAVLRTRWSWKGDDPVSEWLDILDRFEPGARWEWPKEAVQAFEKWQGWSDPDEYRRFRMSQQRDDNPTAAPSRPAIRCSVCNDLPLAEPCIACHPEAATP